MDQSHFFRNVQPLGLVGRSPVQDHDEKIIRVSIPDLIQKAVHALRVHFFSRYEVERLILGAHGRIFIIVSSPSSVLGGERTLSSESEKG